eukprot:NODE_39_length_35218_cov_0.479655.p32 type:complete len:148 gc:universal NODE_39_length_35218_cov_0.479655:23383-23826(+)
MLFGSFVLLSLGGTFWYTNIKILEMYFSVERVLDSQLYLQELTLLATLPISVILMNLEPYYCLLLFVYILFCKNSLLQLINLIIRAIRMPVHFVDVIFGDFLTSYAKVFSDMTPSVGLKPWITWYFLLIKHSLHYTSQAMLGGIYIQ